MLELNSGGFNPNSTSRSPVLLNPKAVASFIAPLIRKNQEELWVIALSPGKRVLCRDAVFRGTVDECLAHPRDIIRFVCQYNASSFIISHNHPSGELEVSNADWQMTMRLIEIGHLIQIPLEDHILIASPYYRSLRLLKPELFEL